MIAVFQIAGMSALLYDKLYSRVKKPMPLGVTQVLYLMDSKCIGTRGPGVTRAADCRDHGLFSERVRIGVRGLSLSRLRLLRRAWGSVVW